MPELPEVETLARGLRTHVQGKTIRTLTILEKKKFRGRPRQLQRFVTGKKIDAIERRGKWLVVRLSSGYGFIIHLKMTGQLLYQSAAIKTKSGRTPASSMPTFLGGHTMVRDEFMMTAHLPNRHTRVIFNFGDGARLFFQDMRKFGYVELYSPRDLANYFTKKKLGIEPLEPGFTMEYWQQQLQRHSATSIKAMLLNQAIVAGIGNIYADDICWTAHVRPTRRIRGLRLAEREALWRACKKVITNGVRLGGTSFSHYFRLDGTLGQYWQKRKVYGRTGEPCRRCHTPITKIRHASRGTHYCACCQK